MMNNDIVAKVAEIFAAMLMFNLNQSIDSLRRGLSCNVGVCECQTSMFWLLSL